MHNPPHPGLLVKKTLINEESEVSSITEAAAMLGVSRLALSRLVNGYSGISPEMAIRLSIALNTSSEMWLNMQTTYNLWLAEKKRRTLMKKVKRMYSNKHGNKAS